MDKPYSESCDQNKDHILAIIKPLLAASANVLEIGSGTGQHAIHFAENLPHSTWRTSDCQSYLAGISLWLAETSVKNIVAPIELDVSASNWPVLDVDAVFTANSLHIMADEDVANLINGVGSLLKSQASLLIYGPFNYNGQYTSESNERFDQWLKARNAFSGIKNFEEIVTQANNNGMSLVNDYEMPANNRILHFIKL